MIKHSATLAINEKIDARRAAGLPVIHLGFGEAGLPVPPEVAAALAEATTANAYGPVAGSPDTRRAVAGYYTRRGLPTEADGVVLAPGSKALLYAALAALPGDLVLPIPCWVSYAAQAQLTGKRVIGVPIPEDAGGIPDPERLERALTQARAAGADPRIMILTLPDNPTGTQAGTDAVKRVCELAEQYDMVIISDEIYRDLAYDPSAQLSPATLLPERTVVTGGLSKNMALGGWRIGFARLPDGAPGRELHSEIIGIASEIWSSLAMPMQAAASYVLDEPEPVVEHIAAARRLHATVSGAVHAAFTEAGANCRIPTAAFYCYPDFEPLRPALRARGLTTGVALAEHLLEEHGVGVLAGEHFGDAPDAYRFRVASSLLYGEASAQRWEALRSTDPLALPWIADTLSQLRSVLATLA
ncbi:MAG: pyridoxal phosphate-dependent aminotransferase [Sciscionella sp.]